MLTSSSSSCRVKVKEVSKMRWKVTPHPPVANIDTVRYLLLEAKNAGTIKEVFSMISAFPSFYFEVQAEADIKKEDLEKIVCSRADVAPLL